MRTCLCILLLTVATSALADTPSHSGPYAAALSLPISIQNEADVAIENGRAYLAARQSPDGLWNTGGTAFSSLPAFAFLEPPVPGAVPPEPLRRAVQASFRRLIAAVPHPQHHDAVRTLAEDSLVVAAALSVFDAPPLLDTDASPSLLAAVRRRLAAIQPGSQPPATDWLCRTSLDLLGEPASDPSRWTPLYTALARMPSPRPGDVALAGYARVRHGAPDDSPDALLAHLRWLRAHTDLFSDAAPSASPEDLYFLTAFLDALPPALPSRAGIPADWRTRTAQRLIATARSSDGAACWPADTDADTLRQTLFAVATLVGL